MKQKFKEAHMKVAEVYAQLSSAVRLKVGCVIVKDNRIISIGYNGMPSGWTNECEYALLNESGTAAQLDEDGVPIIVTKPEVLHAETNAIAKLAGSSESGKDASLFVTHAPCLNCAKTIYQSGIKEVYYKNDYRSREGIDFLERCNVKVEKHD